MDKTHSVYNGDHLHLPWCKWVHPTSESKCGTVDEDDWILGILAFKARDTKIRDPSPFYNMNINDNNDHKVTMTISFLPIALPPIVLVSPFLTVSV
mmetsp:Transcript_34784/g.73408  ORF Transcript_34784/g.73408 Transcript_34784/m.73408 type:complete len:96 (+) Transcript_34784:196-483(+)